MFEKEEMGEYYGEGVEWGTLITNPNRMISDEFVVLKTEIKNDGEGEDEERQEDEEDEEEMEASGVYNYEKDNNANSMEGKVRSKRVNISQRRAAKCGSNGDASRMDVTVSSSQSLQGNGGISPTKLFESPMTVPNPQPSPPTGTLQFPPVKHESIELHSAIEEKSCDVGSCFTFQPPGGSMFWPCISDLQNQPTMPSENVVLKALKSTNQSANGASQTNNQMPPPKEPLMPMRNTEDGYNWRKYGQKQVKGSEYPRSYYKCTHPNCPVKKIVERSHDGHITEIIYKGAHNHQIPHLGQQNIIGSQASSQINEANGSYVKIEGGEVWRNIQPIKFGSENGLEFSSSTSVLTDNSDLELSFSNGNEEDGAEHESDEEKSELKRRKKGNLLLETSLVSRAMREPKVVVQIQSEVDILDDGYRWRKYGQKVVKGNPNPRSYYKCTSPGCLVRKHVERASDDLKAVLTTYEGKHNHEVPAARNSSHTNISPNLPLSQITNIPKSEPQIQDFEQKNYMPSNFAPSFDPQKFQASSSYQSKFGHFQNSMPVLPDFPMSLPMTIPPANMVHNDFNFNNNGKRVRQVQSFVSGQQFRDNNNNNNDDGIYLQPKLEQDDGFYDTLLPVTDHLNKTSLRYLPWNI